MVKDFVVVKSTFCSRKVVIVVNNNLQLVTVSYLNNEIFSCSI